jgi:hypothetical protein
MGHLEIFIFARKEKSIFRHIHSTILAVNSTLYYFDKGYAHLWIIIHRLSYAKIISLMRKNQFRGSTASLNFRLTPLLEIPCSVGIVFFDELLGSIVN